MNQLRVFLPFLMTAVLAACGGGGGSSSAPSSVVLADTTAPVITLTGDNPQAVDLNAEYQEFGASTDTGEAVDIDATAVDTGSVGSYTVIYNATDAAGNQATEKTRTVNVTDSMPVDTFITINVEVAPNNNGLGNIYVIDGVQNKSLTLEAGKIYKFVYPPEHSLRFSTTADGTHGGGVEYTDGVTTSTNGETLIEVTAATPVTLYYFCTLHSGMGGTVNIGDSSAESTKSSVLTAIVDGIVIPNYKDLAEKTASFSATDGSIAVYCAALGTSDESVKLDEAQESWKSVMHAVQKTEMHIFGPAALNNLSLRNRVHFYLEKDRQLQTVSTCATDVAVVNANTETDFQVAGTSANQRSMSALEYLLFNDDLEHTCAANVSTVSSWNALSDADRKVQRCALSELIATDVATNAEQIHVDWTASRDEFLNPDEVGTRFELMTDGLFYFEKYSKSAKINGPIGIDDLCPDDQLTCSEFVESPYSETSLDNIKTNAEQMLAIFDRGLDNLANETAPGDWSATFKGLISDVINEITEMQAAVPNSSLKDRVASIVSDNDAASCQSAFGSPEIPSAFPICNLGGLVKRVTDDLKIEFITYLGVDLPEGSGGDTD
jgi:hypothetical protein